MARGIPMEKAVQEAIVAAYVSGKTAKEVAESYHTDGCTVVRYVRKAGLPTRSRAEVTAARNRARGVHIDLERLKALIEAKLSTTEIAKELGVSQPTIEMKMRRLGLYSKHGRGSKMEKNYFWKGGVQHDDDGYILIKSPGHPYATKAGYVREHRLVMEQVLGRYLEPHEIVHHRDTRQKANNDPGNLVVYANNSEHFLHEHMEHPRDAKTGRFLRKQEYPLSLAPDE